MMAPAIDMTQLHGIDDSFEQVMILTTARRHARGVQRLPDRLDRGRRVAAVQIETEAQARAVLTALDKEGRVLHLDVERKRDVNLMQTARRVVRHAEVRQIKPNDLTVDALQALLVDRLGPDLTDIRITIVGTGNLAFKFALRLAESGAKVGLTGRSQDKLRLLVSAINTVLPVHARNPVEPRRIRGSGVLISAVTAEAVIDSEWIDSLAPSALCIDVGIGNLSADFIAESMQAGHECVRLDVRSAGDPLPPHPNHFFEEVSGRRQLQGATIVAGGLIGQFGEVVVDAIVGPSKVIGIANGTGGLLPPDSWPDDFQARVEMVKSNLGLHDEG